MKQLLFFQTQQKPQLNGIHRHKHMNTHRMFVLLDLLIVIKQAQTDVKSISQTMQTTVHHVKTNAVRQMALQYVQTALVQ